jgi:hypothetical protein
MGLYQFGLEDECVKVYDPVEKKLLFSFDSYAAASKKLGITTDSIKKATKSKLRRYSPFLAKDVALRIGIKNKQT